MTAASHRSEHDLLGDRDVPADAYWGMHTLRAVENFPITGSRSPATRISSTPWPPSSRPPPAPTRNSACSTRTRTRAIVAACQEIRDGRAARSVHRRRDPGRRRHLDKHERQRGHRQPGAGAARAPKGDYKRLHPNEHVNLGQSTNDVYPTALKIAAWSRCEGCSGPWRCCGRPSPAKAVEFATC